MKLSYGSFPLLLLLFTACSYIENEPAVVPEPAPDARAYPGVDEALWLYFARYEQEAARRGVEAELVAAEITGTIENLPGEQVAGQCNYHSHEPNHVTIDQDFWEHASERFKEYVVFHELGHCHLLRGHREEAFPDGTCRSIMRSGTGSCRDNYRAETRSGYLDELFDPAFRDELINN